MAFIINHLSPLYHRQLLSSAFLSLAISAVVHVLLAHLPLSSLSSILVSLLHVRLYVRFASSASPSSIDASEKASDIIRATQVVIYSGAGNQSTPQSKRQRSIQPSAYADPFVPATLVIDVVSVSVHSTFPDDISARWEAFPQSEYVDSGRIHEQDCDLAAAVCGPCDMLDDDGNFLTVCYNSNAKALLISFLFVYYAQYADRLDAQRFHFGLRFDAHNFRVRVRNNFSIMCTGSWLQRSMH